MSRLTEKDNFEEHLGDGMHCDYVKFPDGKCAIYNKLAEYENTGLEPKEVEQLNEPSREECRLIANKYNVCSCCDYNMNSLIKEIVVGCDTEDFCDCGRAVVHQVFWTDKYMNYCPNCGAKIKIGEER